MGLLWFVKEVLDNLGVKIRSEGLLSIVKTFADGLSRLLSHEDLWVYKQLRGFIVDGIKDPIDA